MRCFYCMEEYDEDLDVICPYCGNDVVSPDNDSYCLTAGTTLKQRYVLGRVLGDGGFGITYIGYDKALKRKVAVKEFFPNESVTRQRGESEVVPYSGERGERYEKGLKNFQREAQRLAKLGSIDGVVNVYDVFDENNTSYIVMEYLSGETVAQMMNGHKFLGFGKTMNIIVSVLKSLKKVHAAGVIHRDISPKNIIKTAEGKIVLIDFGAAKPSTIDVKTASIILTQGFAPIEQYDNNLSQGTWTDVYAVAATMYYMLTGITPDSANSRVISDTLVPPSEIHPGLPDKLDEIMEKALAVRPEDRTQTAGELLEQIWTLRNSQNTTRKSKDNSVQQAAPKVNIPPTPIQKVKKQSSAKPHTEQQWKKYAGGERKSGTPIISEQEETPISQPITPKAQPEPMVPKKPSKKKLSIPLIATIFILVAVLGGLIGFGYHDKQNNAEIPNFVGAGIDSILDNSEYSFKFNVIYTYDPNQPLETVISQSPMPTSRHVSKDTEIRLTVNSKKTEVNIPVLTKMTEAVAVNALKALYLESEVIIVNNDEYDDGMVVSSEPSSGSKVKVGSTVKLYIAQNSVAVPLLAGKTLQQATEELSNLGLSISEVFYDYSDEYDTGCVISQGIEPGTKVVKGTAVSIVLSSGRPIPITLETEVSLDGLQTPFTIKVLCDGVLEYERKRYSLVFENSETISITRNINEAPKAVEVYINGEMYQTFTFDFENGTVTLDNIYEVSASKKNSTSSKSSESSKTTTSSEPATSSTVSEADTTPQSETSSIPEVISTTPESEQPTVSFSLTSSTP